MLKQKLQNLPNPHRGNSCPSLPTINNPTAGHCYSSLSIATADVPPCCYNTTCSIPDASTSSVVVVDDAAGTTSINPCYAAATNAVKPLTEEHLQEHTLKTALGYQGRQRRVKHYVESQVRLLRLQADLETRRIAEMRALVPLDTPGVDDHVIHDTVASLQHPILSDSDDDGGAATDSHQQQQGCRMRIQPWIDWMKRRLLHHRTPNMSTLITRRRWRSSGISRPSSSSTQQSPLQPLQPQLQPQPNNNLRRRHSTYGHYRDEKYLLIQQGLHGLSNPNIASALGVSRTDAYASCLASHLFLSSPQLQHQHLASAAATLAHQKRDSGVSVLTKSVVPQTKPMQQMLRKRGSRPLSRTTGMDTEKIVATRYPRMVSQRTLRDAAIRALSSDMSLFGHSTSSTSSFGGSVNNNSNGTPEPCCCIHHHHHQSSNNGI